MGVLTLHDVIGVLVPDADKASLRFKGHLTAEPGSSIANRPTLGNDLVTDRVGNR